MSIAVAGGLLVSACSRDGDSVAEAPATSAPVLEPEPTSATTNPLETTSPTSTASSPAASTIAPTTTISATTTVAPTTSTTTITTIPATTTTTVPPVLSTPAGPAGTQWIAGVEEGDPEVASDGTNCLGFHEATGATTYSACGEWQAIGETYVWTVTKGVSNRFFAVVWKETTPFNWSPRLRMLEPAAGLWDSLTIKAADIDGGPNQELISGIRLNGTGGFLDLDVADNIGGNPVIVAHVEGIESGTAFTQASVGVRFWEANFAPADPLCCPTSWSEFLLSVVAGGWSVTPGVVEAPIEAIPSPSEF